MALLLFFACTDVVEAFVVVEVAVGLVSAMFVIFKFLNESFYVFDFLAVTILRKKTIESLHDPKFFHRYAFCFINSSDLIRFWDFNYRLLKILFSIHIAMPQSDSICLP